ncbi:molecular chaperone DnaK [Anaeromyxobacter oryzisoli]|uniref:molecular chaperone DnaK n=1 Tax=Anaeromyxobacter oryzisoli TaxID=2925408 RepID=UPI001F5902B3|nr:molecular chaperone DnaK [Anaeromyxobacter sp. SG63]
MTELEPVIGIDLGTTNSAVATVRDGVPRVIPNRSGQLLTPSVVAVAKNGRRLVGALAKRQAITNAEGTVFAAKRLIGRRWGSKEVEDARGVLPYALRPGPDGNDVRVEIGGRVVSIQEISALVLAELKADAEAWFGRPVTKAVITVPAYFNDGQRHATRDAGRIAGLDVLRMVNEPTSAALAYGFGKQLDGRKVVVFDLGGGTFDVSILDVGRSVYDVVAVGGDTYLGGEDFDRRVMDWLTFGFAKENGGIDLRQDKMALQRLRDAAEQAKVELSAAPETSIHLPFLAGGGEGKPALHLVRQLGRDKLEELTKDLVERCVAVTARTLRDAGVRPGQVDEVILVGGMTRMPRVQRAVKEFFGREPCRGVHPEEVVALGAAIQAHALTAPAPDRDVLLLDVTPQNLGILVVGGYFQIVIPRNTTVPTSQTHLFTTVLDNQTSVRIAVLQGEGERAVDNELLGEFVLDGIRPARRGEVEIEVTFDISADGIVSVAARDVGTGQQQSITVTSTSGLTEEELRRILDEQIDEALEKKQTARDFEPRRERALAAVAELEASLPAARAALAATRFGADAAQRVEGVLARVRRAVAARDAAALGAEDENLERALQLVRGLAAPRRPRQPGER